MLTTELAKNIHKMNKPSRAALPLDPFYAEKPQVSAMTKIAITGALLLSILAFLSAVFMTRSMSTEKSERTALEAARVQLQDQIDTLQQDNQNLESQVGQLQEQLKSYSNENAKVKKDLEQSYIEISNGRKKISTLEEKNRTLQSQVDELNRKTVQQLHSQSEVNAASDMTASNLIPVSSPEVSMPMPAPVSTIQEVKTETVESPLPSVTEPSPFIVMTVNRRFNFVVVNLGIKDGLKMGDQMQISRENKKIAVVQVEKLYDHFAAATILNESGKKQVEKGDLVAKL